MEKCCFGPPPLLENIQFLCPFRQYTCPIFFKTALRGVQHLQRPSELAKVAAHDQMIKKEDQKQPGFLQIPDFWLDQVYFSPLIHEPGQILRPQQQI